MFVLRKIDSKLIETNYHLGSGYDLVNANDSPEEFNRLLKQNFPDETEYRRDQILGFVLPHGGGLDITLLRDHSNYIMTERGATFAKLN